MGADAQGEGRSSGRRKAVTWALTAASPLIAYLIVKAAAAGVSQSAALTMATLPPEDPSPMLAAVNRVAQQPTLKVTSDMQLMAQAGLVSLPLAYEPFFVAARAAEQKGDLRRAILLMEEARRRRASAMPIRMQLMIYYIKVERFPEALGEIDIILKRNPELRPALLPELSKLVADPRGRAALAPMLAGEPAWREEFFAAAAARKLAPADARDLYARVRAHKPKGDVALERQLILQAQASSGDHAGARQTWLASLPAQERAAFRFLFDGSFTGRKAPRPFGWEYKDAAAGRAEPSRDGNRSYLDVAYFGGQAISLAEQGLALSPGRHTLRLVARSPNTIASGKLYWRITCLPGGAQIGALDMSRAVADDRRFTAAFDVPASGCAGQTLTLMAEPGDVATVVNLEISRMEIGR